jgi:acyl carrier protein
MIEPAKTKETLARLCRKPLAKVTDEALMTDLVSDSFALVEVVIELQEELGVRLVSEHLKGVKTVGDFARVVAERSAAQAAGKA